MDIQQFLRDLMAGGEETAQEASRRRSARYDVPEDFQQKLDLALSSSGLVGPVYNYTKMIGGNTPIVTSQDMTRTYTPNAWGRFLQNVLPDAIQPETTSEFLPAGSLSPKVIETTADFAGAIPMTGVASGGARAVLSGAMPDPNVLGANAPHVPAVNYEDWLAMLGLEDNPNHFADWANDLSPGTTYNAGGPDPVEAQYAQMAADINKAFDEMYGQAPLPEPTQVPVTTGTNDYLTQYGMPPPPSQEPFDIYSPGPTAGQQMQDWLAKNSTPKPPAAPATPPVAPVKYPEYKKWQTGKVLDYDQWLKHHGLADTGEHAEDWANQWLPGTTKPTAAPAKPLTAPPPQINVEAEKHFSKLVAHFKAEGLTDSAADQVAKQTVAQYVNNVTKPGGKLLHEWADKGIFLGEAQKWTAQAPPKPAQGAPLLGASIDEQLETWLMHGPMKVKQDAVSAVIEEAKKYPGIYKDVWKGIGMDYKNVSPTKATTGMKAPPLPSVKAAADKQKMIETAVKNGWNEEKLKAHYGKNPIGFADEDMFNKAPPAWVDSEWKAGKGPYAANASPMIEYTKMVAHFTDGGATESQANALAKQVLKKYDPKAVANKAGQKWSGLGIDMGLAKAWSDKIESGKSLPAPVATPGLSPFHYAKNKFVAPAKPAIVSSSSYQNLPLSKSNTGEWRDAMHYIYQEDLPVRHLVSKIMDSRSSYAEQFAASEELVKQLGPDWHTKLKRFQDIPHGIDMYKDPDWLKKVPTTFQGGPKQREQAIAGGFDPNLMLYKGSRYPEREFYPNTTKPRSQWTFMADEPKVGGSYGRYLYPLHADFGPNVWEKDFGGEGIGTRFNDWLFAGTEQGATGMIAKNISDIGSDYGKTQTQYMIREPRQARSTYAEFDPAQRQSGKLTSGYATGINPFVSGQEEQQRAGAINPFPWLPQVPLAPSQPVRARLPGEETIDPFLLLGR